ncbi:MAG: DUF222 domain-containing protein [Actinomycetota bacterium]
MDRWNHDASDEQVVRALAVYRSVSGAGLVRQLEMIALVDERKLWRADGATDAAAWVAAENGITRWAAQRWVAAAHAIEALPATGRALASGDLPIDKVVELTRFATPEDEDKLIVWARRVSARAVRERADLATRSPLEEVQDEHRARYLNYWFEDHGFGLEARLPAEQGARVAKALDRLAEKAPVSPEGSTLEARRAGALVQMASAQIASDPDPDRATVVVHAPLAALCGERGSCEIEGGPVLHPEVARMLACGARIETVLHDGARVARVGSTARLAPPSMIRLLRQRDRGCVFPCCERRRYVQAHHIVAWPAGPTEPDNLVLLCSDHHDLIHVFGWRVVLARDGTVHWFKPNNQPYEPGRSPPILVGS